jgi:hypothetical protein
MSVKVPKNTPKKTKNQKRKEFDVDLLLPEKKKTIENTLENEQSINETLKKSFLKHLEMTFNVSQSLKRSGLSSRQYRLFLENDFEFNQSVQDLTDELIDFAKSKLFKFINIEPYYKDNDGNIHKHPLSKECLNATKFLLDKIGSTNGWNGELTPDIYKEKQDNTIEIVIVEPDGTKKPKRKTLGPIDETN